MTGSQGSQSYAGRLRELVARCGNTYDVHFEVDRYVILRSANLDASWKDTAFPGDRRSPTTRSASACSRRKPPLRRLQWSWRQPSIKRPDATFDLLASMHYIARAGATSAALHWTWMTVFLALFMALQLLVCMFDCSTVYETSTTCRTASMHSCIQFVW